MKDTLRQLNEREKDTLRAVLISQLPTVEQVVQAFDKALKLNTSLDILRDKVDPPKRKK